jgi:biopolymer transport protein TolR
MKLSPRRRPRHTTLPEVNVIPLIDVSLMLLVVFMVTTPMLQHGIKVELPQGQSQETKDAKQDLVVYIEKAADSKSKEKLYLNDTAMTQDALLSKLKSKTQGQTDKTVFVKADRAVNYGKVIEIVDQIKCVGGIKYVALATHRVA